MINLKGGDLHAVALEYRTFLDFLDGDSNSRRWKALVYIAPDMDVESVRLLEMFHHVPNPLGASNLKRFLAAENPAGKPQIRYADGVVRVEVCEKQSRYVLEWNAKLAEALGRPAAAIEKQLLLTGLDQDAGPRNGPWPAAASPSRAGSG